jgi:hypothetical protein
LAPFHLAPRAAAPLALPQGRHYPHSIGSNCEEDDSAGVLDTLKEFMKDKQVIDKSDLPVVRRPIYGPVPGQLETGSSRKDVATPYVAGVVARKKKSIAVTAFY